MIGNETNELVQEIMLDFACLTGLEPVDDRPQRYLWTDAFAVCNYLELFGRTNDKSYQNLALRLVDQVHHTLGQHRKDDPRHGWISGLEGQDGERHPTRGGLRIGKQLSERRPNEGFDERLEWDKDGQYFHYLTKWMHALNCMGRVNEDPMYIRWAIELAKIAHDRFTYSPLSGGKKRIYWKMSIDLTYPLVLSMGQHDPLDGLVTYSELQATATNEFKDASLPNLKYEIADMEEICLGVGANLTTEDPLGIGGLLFDGLRIAQLVKKNLLKYEGLLGNVVDSALHGLRSFANGETIEYPAQNRLAFRELGLCIGLAAVETLHKEIEETPSMFQGQGRLQQRVENLLAYLPLRDLIEQFWLDDRNRKASTWIDHNEINLVMLATSLASNEFLKI